MALILLPRIATSAVMGHGASDMPSSDPRSPARIRAAWCVAIPVASCLEDILTAVAAGRTTISKKGPVVNQAVKQQNDFVEREKRKAALAEKRRIQRQKELKAKQEEYRKAKEERMAEQAREAEQRQKQDEMKKKQAQDRAKRKKQMMEERMKQERERREQENQEKWEADKEKRRQEREEAK